MICKCFGLCMQNVSHVTPLSDPNQVFIALLYVIRGSSRIFGGGGGGGGGGLVRQRHHFLYL